MTDAQRLDRRLIRRSFDRAASTYDGAAALQREVADRMLERLDLLRDAPASVLDAGSGTGYAAVRLRERYRGTDVVELDIALGMLRQASSQAGWRERARALLGAGRARRVCADLVALPFAPASFGMVWSNLALQWVEDLPAAFAGMWRILRPGGVLMFSTFGPDTLKELRGAFAAVDAGTHVNRFVDMHDIGDLLVQARFADPVVDMEVITMTYADVRALMRELKAIGAHNVNAGRPAGLTGRAALARLAAAYEAFRIDGRLPATFEVVYGHAWKPEAPRTTEDGRAIVRFEPRAGRS